MREIDPGVESCLTLKNLALWCSNMHSVSVPSHAVVCLLASTLSLPVSTPGRWHAGGLQCTEFRLTAPSCRPSASVQIRCAYPDSTTDKMDTGGHMCVQEATCDNINQARRLGQGFKMSSLKRV